MAIADELYSNIVGILGYGEQVRFKYYNQTILGGGSYYDDAVTLTQSGTDFWTSGLIQPLDTSRGRNESLLLQQGKILYDDKKLYVNGSVQTSGLGLIKVGTGSPVTNEYQILNEGQVVYWTLNSKPIYKKCFIRILTNGSFVGE